VKARTMKEMMNTRDAYGKALVELGRNNKNIVALDADLSTSTRTAWFGDEFPERFFNFGIAEANMISAAAGFASCGKIPFVSTFAVFATGRAYNQLRTSVAFANLNVKVVASHGGIIVGADGPTHHCIEDVAIMRVLPNFTVVVPADAYETEAAVKACVKHVGPLYMRLTRPSIPVVYEKDYCWKGEPLKFRIGGSVTLREGGDVAIMAIGPMVSEALDAAEELTRESVDARVIDLHTVKPLDEETVIRAARETGAVVTVEDHSVLGGLGSAVAELLVERALVPMVKVGVMDSFCESGEPEDLLVKYGLTAPNIVAAAKKAVARKG